MRIQEYFNMHNEYIIEHLTLNENTQSAIDEELYKKLYYCFSENEINGYHLLTYSNDLDQYSTEFYVRTNGSILEECTKLNSEDIKLQINYMANTLKFTLNIFMSGNKVKVPLIFDLVEKQTSFELSRLLKQKYIDLHFISDKEGVLYKEHSVKVFITDKITSIILEFLELFLNSYNVNDQKTIINLDDILIHSKISYLKIPIHRADVEKLDTSKYEDILATLYPNILITHNFCERVDFILEGYEDEKREIWQIPEIRKFIKNLNKKFHQWFYFFDKKSESLYWITMCLCGKGFGDEDKSYMNHLIFNDFVNEQLHSLNELCYYLNDADKYNEIRESAFQYYRIYS